MMGRAKGGKVTHGTKTYEDGLKNGTQVSHEPGKSDWKNLGIKSPVVPTKPGFARGGTPHQYPEMTAGAASGDGRIQKIEKYGNKYAKGRTA